MSTISRCFWAPKWAIKPILNRQNTKLGAARKIEQSHFRSIQQCESAERETLGTAIRFWKLSSQMTTHFWANVTVPDSMHYNRSPDRDTFRSRYKSSHSAKTFFLPFKWTTDSPLWLNSEPILIKHFCCSIEMLSTVQYLCVLFLNQKDRFGVSLCRQTGFRT